MLMCGNWPDSTWAVLWESKAGNVTASDSTFQINFATGAACCVAFYFAHTHTHTHVTGSRPGAGLESSLVQPTDKTGSFLQAGY